MNKTSKCILLFLALILCGCQNNKFDPGEYVAYCVIESKAPRVLCINGLVAKENPLYGIKQGEKPYFNITLGNSLLASCYCNPNLTTKSENAQQGLKD